MFPQVLLIYVLYAYPLALFQVARHLSKLFDNMAALKFKKNDNDEESKEASGMYSKENEYVDFDKPCDCSGQVSWDSLDYNPVDIEFYSHLFCCYSYIFFVVV